MKYLFSEKEMGEIQEARRKNRDKNVDRRLKALELKAAGHTGREIAELTGYNPVYISHYSLTKTSNNPTTSSNTANGIRGKDNR